MINMDMPEEEEEQQPIEEQEQQKQANNKPTILGTKIRLAGDKDNCGHCKEGDDFFTQKAMETGGTATYEYHHIESDKGKEIAENLGDEGPDGSLPIPAIEYCKEIKDEETGNIEEKCDYIQGFKKNEWDNKLNYKRRNDVDDEIDELFG